MSFTKDEVRETAENYFAALQGPENAKLPAGVWTDKYALRDRENRFYELTPDDMHWRMAREFARTEAKYPNPLSTGQIYDYLRAFSKIVPQGSPSFGIGNDHQLVSLSNCAVLASPVDNLSGIMETARDMASLYKRRFGNGHDLGLLRPDGASVNNAAITSTGAHSFMDFYSYVTRMVGQSGRRGALMLSMPILHPDSPAFITKKNDKSLVTGANVSVRVDDEFMLAVEADDYVMLRFPVDAKVQRLSREEAQLLAPEMVTEDAKAWWYHPDAKFTKVVRARDLFRMIAEQATANAEPGVLFWDTIQKNLPLDFYREQGFETISTNPCGEIPLCAHDSCRLISIYLAGFVRNPFTPEAYFDLPDFVDTVRVAMRLSDDLVDLELEKLREIQRIADTQDEKDLFAKFIEKAEQGRRTGLGTHGLADMLARLNLRYDSTDAIEVVDHLYRTMKLTAYRESVNLAKERGPFPMYDPVVELECEFIKRIQDEDPVLYEDMVTYGRRNGAILTNAPTGSISILSENCSSGIEPMFMASYDRKRKVDASKVDVTKRADLYRDAQGDYWETYKVFHPNVEKWMKLAFEGQVKSQRKGLLHRNPEKHDARVSGLSFEQFKDEVALPDLFVAAGDIDWQKRIEMQAAIQKHIDHSISSTLNLPKGTTPEAVEAIYMAAWKAGCKGVTVYVDGSREAQVLSASGSDTKGEATLEEQVAMGVGALEDISEMLGVECTLDDIQKAISRLQEGEDRDYRETMFIGSLQSEVSRLTKQLNKVASAVGTDVDADSIISGIQRFGRTHRGLATAGEQVKATFQNMDGKSRKVYVYIGKNELGQPVEAFVTDANGDEDLIPYGSALGKLTSLALKHGIAPLDVAEALIGLKGGSVSYSGKVYNSVPDMVGKLLAKATEEYDAKLAIEEVKKERVLEERKRNPIKLLDKEPDPMAVLSAPKKKLASGSDYARGGEPSKSVMDTGDTRKPTVTIPRAIKGYSTCPNCNGADLRLVDGCPSCGECGWAKCS